MAGGSDGRGWSVPLARPWFQSYSFLGLGTCDVQEARLVILNLRVKRSLYSAVSEYVLGIHYLSCVAEFKTFRNRW